MSNWARISIQNCIIFVILIIARADGKEITSDPSDASKASPRIIVIGAGAAGIAAASKLLENGFENVKILEAEARIGGRIHTAQFFDYSIDLGAQWVHGESENVAYELGEPLGVFGKSDEPAHGFRRAEYFDSRGNMLQKDIAKNLTSFISEKLFRMTFEERPKSFGECAEKLFKESFDKQSKIYNDKNRYLSLLESITNGYYGTKSWHDLSVDIDQCKLLPGDQMINWKEKGSSMLLDIMMKQLPDQKREQSLLNNTILDSEVLFVDYLPSGEGPPVLITTTKGFLHQADHVIVTVSLGVLKEKYKSFFIPPLPDYKVQTINAIGYGSVAKIYVLFEKPFWKVEDDGKVLHFMFTWNEAEKKTLQNDKEKSWVLGIYDVSTVEYKPNLLEMWIAGNYSQAMERLPEFKVFDHAVEVLQQFLGRKYKLENPKAMYLSQWYMNPHFRGAYSFRSLEMEKQKVSADMLAKPLENLRVLFAGEATSSDRFSTVDGAIATGWSAADTLINHYKK
ncbi:hypothetical protein TKK_0004978 [Trichogramma kaykai]|uniref:Amine oxidase domain-containing protein n=1 Tax=Trichogramma kaykai TaxID=54128 RepID=A0ABD2XK35_9HYME